MRIESNKSEYAIAIRLVNLRSTSTTFLLEPWGEEYAMPPGAAFVLVARGPEKGFPEIEFSDDHITVSAWSGSIATIYHDGVELGAGFWKRTPVP
jgi:hypothetical protein